MIREGGSYFYEPHRFLQKLDRGVEAKIKKLDSGAR